MKAWQSTFNKALNSVKSNLLFVDCFGLRPRNDGERDCSAFSMPRNDREKKTVIPSVAKESRIKKVNFKNLVLLINEFYKKWIASAFSMPCNDREKKTVIPSVAKESRIKKVNFKNLVLLINEFYKKWIARQWRTLVSAFSMPRNDKHISKFEIISHNKNLKSIYYGFLFNKQNFIVRGGIGQ